MANKNYTSQLRLLIEEYMIAIELKKHERVFQLSLTINDSLIEILDDDLSELNEVEETSEDIESSVEYRIVSSLCQRIRDQGYLALTYDKVTEFVRLRDLVCLSKLVGAIPDTDDVLDSVKFNYDLDSRVLRQSIELMKYIDSNGTIKLPNKEVWLNRDCFELIASIGFPKYVIETEKASSIRETNNDLEILLTSLPETSRIGYHTITNLMRDEWFVQFLNRTLIPPYPIDRFTILVAILMIANDCRHRPLLQLIYELIDQVYHEEANSGSVEDLMSLTQVGSIWLSYHKRHRATMKHANKQMMQEGLEDIDGLMDDDELDSSPSSISSLSSSLEVTGAQKAQLKATEASGSHQSTDLRFKMRRLIDEELLYGSACLICNQTPSELLGPIKNSNPMCSGCGFNLFSAGLKCALSYRSLEILYFNSVTQFLPTKPVILSPSEWIRELIASKRLGRPPEEEEEEDFQVGEQVDISEKFERLTVIRGSKKRRRDEKYSPDDDTDDSSSSDQDSSEDCMSGGVVANKSELDGNTHHMMSVLRNFMKFRSNHSTTGIHPKPSEFILMLKHLKTNHNKPSWLPICSLDILLLDSRSSLIKVGLVSSNRNLFESGSIWQCGSHSVVSELPLGCGQTFCSLELIRLGQNSSLGDYKCPLCQRNLKEIKTFAAESLLA